MAKLNIIVTTFFFCFFTSLSAKPKQVKCEGTYTYNYSTGISLDEARAKALEYAITNALADEFGTTVKSESYLEITNTRDNFNQISRLIVKGKWVKDIHAPVFSDPIYSNNMFAINVTVSFYAQPLESAPIQFTSKILRNGTEDKFESDTFVGNTQDRIYVSFQSPQSGYVAVFLEGIDKAFCALPYWGSEEAFHIKKNERYVFFNDTYNSYHITCGADPEINFVHILFSPKKFIDNSLIREMSRQQFREWLGTLQSYDEKMQVQSTMIKVSPK